MAQETAFSFFYMRTALCQLRKSLKREQIMNFLDYMAHGPLRQQSGTKRLTSFSKNYLQRFGDWRISYVVNVEQRAIRVFEIAQRAGTS
jgi:mRNA-degrading endonuclease RelE of RelBE toxin-antitoxin system